MAMVEVTVIAPMGARVAGPAVIAITKDQHAPRMAVLGGTKPKGGKYTVEGGRAVTFKRGETFKIDVAEGRLNKALFSWDEDEEEAVEDPDVPAKELPIGDEPKEAPEESEPVA